MINEMYYDAFTNEYVLKCEAYAPPERYIFTSRAPDGVIIESWFIKTEDKDKTQMLDIAYSTSADVIEINRVRSEMFRKNNCTPV